MMWYTKGSCGWENKDIWKTTSNNIDERNNIKLKIVHVEKKELDYDKIEEWLNDKK